MDLKKMKVLLFGVLLIITLAFVGLHASYEENCLRRYEDFTPKYSIISGCHVLIDGNIIPAHNPWRNPFK